MSLKNVSFAADILEAALKDNRKLKGKLEEKENIATKRSEQIVDSVKNFVKFRLATSKTNKKRRHFTFSWRLVRILIQNKMITTRFGECLDSQLVRFIETYKNKSMN